MRDLLRSQEIETVESTDDLNRGLPGMSLASPYRS
jgi:hypothetical protein